MVLRSRQIARVSVSLRFPFQHTLDEANLDQSCRQRHCSSLVSRAFFLVRLWTHRVTSEIVCQPLQLVTGAPFHNEWLRVRLCHQTLELRCAISVSLWFPFPHAHNGATSDPSCHQRVSALDTDTTGAPLHDAWFHVVFCPPRS